MGHKRHSNTYDVINIVPLGRICYLEKFKFAVCDLGYTEPLSLPLSHSTSVTELLLLNTRRLTKRSVFQNLTPLRI